jgi:hypothetical protein
MANLLFATREYGLFDFVINLLLILELQAALAESPFDTDQSSTSPRITSMQCMKFEGWHCGI